jgi:hypothetical protein
LLYQYTKTNDFTALERLRRGHVSFCGRNLTNDEEEYEDDSKGLNYEILQAYSNNSSDTVNTIEYLLICLDCKYQTPYSYLWLAICDGREHVLTSKHKIVTITEIVWQNDKASEILRIQIKCAAV